MTAQLPSLTPEGKASLDKLLQTKVESRTVPATFFGATTAAGPIYFNCAGERVFGEPEKGLVNDDTSQYSSSSSRTKVTITSSC
jgi:methyl acetate hydrolase